MRPGNTLIPELLPDARGCLYEQPLALPPRSGRRTFGHFALAVVIPFGLVTLFEGNAILVFMLCMIPRVAPVVILVATMLAASVFTPPTLAAALALALLVTQARLFAKHAVHRATAAPCRPADALAIRARLDARLWRSVIFLPFTVLSGGPRVLARPRGIGRAWVSYLNYNHGEVRAPAAFESPAGSYSRRILLFRLTIAATTIAFLPPPLVDLFGLFGEAPVELRFAEALRLALACVLPGLLVVGISSCVLAPHLSTLGRISREF